MTLMVSSSRFQPTRPLRGATICARTPVRGSGFQPTRPLRGATHVTGLASSAAVFQPTRPLRGATSAPAWRCSPHSHFNPRAPCGARLDLRPDTRARVGISTHAPLAGRDGVFYWDEKPEQKFQPTRPLRGATVRFAGTIRPATDFNPRAPCGARPFPFSIFSDASGFQPTRPLRGATHHSGADIDSINHFNPRAPCGARQ